MKQFLELGGGVFVTGCVMAVGMLAKMILWGYYVLLGRACKNPDSTGNGTIRYIRDGLSQRLGQGKPVKSVTVYTEKCFAERKFAGIRIPMWENISEQSVLITMLSGAVFALGTMLWECKDDGILQNIFAAAGAGMALMVADMIWGIREKRRRARLCIREHVENFWLVDGVPELSVAESTEKKNVKAGKKKEIKQCKAKDEKRRLTEELLRERRIMEARQIAQSKQAEAAPTEENKTEEPMQMREKSDKIQEKLEETVRNLKHAEEEAAATKASERSKDNSYEALLRDVLAEYLA